MTNDKYKLKDKSDTDLNEWLTEQKLGTDEYIAGEEETMRRVAVIEEQMEKAEEPSRKRELIAVSIAIVSLAITIIVIVLSY
ncbi:MAG: hypothetical protein KAJ32_05435 [Gammaproteobacteria bacterium]|nr:hypothetical protein [Gammaproteobacteria bacterium]